MQSHLAAALLGPALNASAMSSVSTSPVPCSSPTPRPTPSTVTHSKPSTSSAPYTKTTNINNSVKTSVATTCKNAGNNTANVKMPSPAPKLLAGETEEGLESEEIEDIIDEEFEDKIKNASQNSRTVTLQMLLAANILQPGESTMTIEYLGQKFVGDLQADGKIKSQETETIFCSPSAWAIHCKRIINPDKKSGCGWASVKYKGRKLDAYKAQWLRKCQQQLQQQRDSTPSEEDIEEIQIKPVEPEIPAKRLVVKHNTINNRMVIHDDNTLVESVSFQSIGKIQPFLISMNSNTELLIDFHCHLTTTEVCGYLGGSWDVNSHSLVITHAFPCLNCKHDRENATKVEQDIQQHMRQHNLLLVGWYHSHPKQAAMPTLRDCDAQLQYQIKMKGPSDSTYSPCIGMICSPYSMDNPTLASDMTCYWVIPPPENRPNEYSRPMSMSYTVVKDTHLSSETMDEMKKCVKYYSSFGCLVDFHDKYNDERTYIEKLKYTLHTKFSKDQSIETLWNFVKDIVNYAGEDDFDVSDLLPKPEQPNARPDAPASVSPVTSSIANVQASMTLPLSVSSQINIPSGLSVSSVSPATSSNSSGKYDLNIPSAKVSADASINNLFSAGSLAASLSGLSGKLPLGASNLGPITSLPSNLSVNNLAASLAATMPSSLTSNLLLNSPDLANVLFPSSKYPNTSSLLGLPDPMSKSTLAANNMFLSPSLLKMQDSFNFLKPQTSTHSTSSSKSDYKTSPIKIPHDLNVTKSSKYDYQTTEMALNALKSGKFDFHNLDAQFKKPNMDFKVSDLSISSVKSPSTGKSDYGLSDGSLNFKTPRNDSFKQPHGVGSKKKSDFSVADLASTPSKMSKMDYSMLDLTMSSGASMNLKSNYVDSLASFSDSILNNLSAATQSHENLLNATSIASTGSTDSASHVNMNSKDRMY